MRLVGGIHEALLPFSECEFVISKYESVNLSVITSCKSVISSYESVITSYESLISSCGSVTPSSEHVITGNESVISSYEFDRSISRC